MSKAVLVVMDTPDSCNVCPFCELVNGRVGCSVSICICEQDYKDKRPSWCPLKELPEKYDPASMNFERGYNACIDDILKGVMKNR